MNVKDFVSKEEYINFCSAVNEGAAFHYKKDVKAGSHKYSLWLNTHEGHPGRAFGFIDYSYHIKGQSPNIGGFSIDPPVNDWEAFKACLSSYLSKYPDFKEETQFSFFT